MSGSADAACDWMGCKTKESVHDMKQEEHNKERISNIEIAKDSSESLGHRIKAAGHVLTEGFKELKHGTQKKYREKEAEKFKEDIVGVDQGTKGYV